MRLTCKTAVGYCDTSIATRENKLQKLGPLEDGEEKLGLPLSFLFSALQESEILISGPRIAYTLDGKLGYADIVMIDFKGKKVLTGYTDALFVTTEKEFPFEEYGKTWALTREELE